MKNGMKKENVISFDNTEDVNRIAKCIKEKEKKGDTVLFKASRAVSLERVINLLKNGGENI